MTVDAFNANDDSSGQHYCERREEIAAISIRQHTRQSSIGTPTRLEHSDVCFPIPAGTMEFTEHTSLDTNLHFCGTACDSFENDSRPPKNALHAIAADCDRPLQPCLGHLTRALLFFKAQIFQHVRAGIDAAAGFE